MNQYKVNHCGDDPKWAGMTLRNAMLTPDTLTTINFHLFTGENRSKLKEYTINLDVKMAKRVASSLLSVADGNDSHALSAVPEAVRVQCLEILSSVEKSMFNDAPAITLDHALAALRKVRVSMQVERIAPVAIMFGSHAYTQRNSADPWRRRIDELKTTTPCFGCHTVGNWFKDRLGRTQAIEFKAVRRPNRNDKPADGFCWPGFRQGGQ